jgi:hypothetical protein
MGKKRSGRGVVRGRPATVTRGQTRAARCGATILPVVILGSEWGSMSDMRIG